MSRLSGAFRDVVLEFPVEREGRVQLMALCRLPCETNETMFPSCDMTTWRN